MGMESPIFCDHAPWLYWGKCLRPQSPGPRVPRPEQSSTEDLTLPAWNFASVVLHLSPPGKPSENVTKNNRFLWENGDNRGI